MKVEIRNYERMLVAFFGVTTIIGYIVQGLNWSPTYTAGFNSHRGPAYPDLKFDEFTNLMLPRIGVVILLMVVYFWINMYSIPQIKRANYKSWRIYLWVLIQFVSLSYLLAIGVNIATYYARPAWNNYGEFSLFAIFGYNETPLTNLWKSFDRALIVVLVYCIYAFIKEFILYRMINAGPRSNYRTLIVNQIGISLCIFILLPYLTSAFHLIEDFSFYRAYIIFVPSVIFVYFSNTYWLFARLEHRKEKAITIVWRIIASTFICSLPIISILVPSRGAVRPNVLLLNWILQLVVVTPITWVLFQQRKDKIRELRGAEIALSKSTADLQFLRSQINPHFLFNILNTIYGMALVDGSKRTANAVQMLGDMMRFMLDDNHQDFIPLENEIKYLENYIALQKLRIQEHDGIEIKETIHVDNCNYEIMPMLLIPFVENAFKHGIDSNEKSWITIDLSCDQKGIRFNVRNSLHVKDLNDPEKEHSGIGLQNVKERLHLFYKGRHQLVCETTEKEFIVDLLIEAQNQKV